MRVNISREIRFDSVVHRWKFCHTGNFLSIRKLRFKTKTHLLGLILSDAFLSLSLSLCFDNNILPPSIIANTKLIFFTHDPFALYTYAYHKCGFTFVSILKCDSIWNKIVLSSAVFLQMVSHHTYTYIHIHANEKKCKYFCSTNSLHQIMQKFTHLARL